MGFDERKELLLKNYKDYFEILDIDMQTRALDFVPQEQWQETLLKNLKNAIECDRLIAETTAYAFHDWYKSSYERKLEIYNRIMEGVK